MAIRQDTYRVGDKVEFQQQDEYLGSDIPERHKAKYGPGPYLVEEIEEVKTSFRGVSHTQFVIINGVTFSGYWFKPIRYHQPSYRIQDE